MNVRPFANDLWRFVKRTHDLVRIHESPYEVTWEVRRPDGTRVAHVGIVSNLMVGQEVFIYAPETWTNLYDTPYPFRTSGHAHVFWEQLADALGLPYERVA